MTARACIRHMPLRGARGAVLFVSIIIVLVLSLIAITAANTTFVEGKMAADARSMQLAALAADSAVNEAKARLAQAIAAHGAAQACAHVRCVVRSPDAPIAPAQFMQSPEALAARTSFRVDLTQLKGIDQSARLAESPSYVIEDLGTHAISPAGDRAAGSSTVHAFHIIARGVGTTPEANRVVETVYTAAP